MTTGIDPKYLPPPVSTTVDKPVDNPGNSRAHSASEFARDRLVTIDGTRARSLQTTIGPSDVGQPCARRLAYKVVGARPVNFRDPLTAMFGTGMHEVIAEGIDRLEGMTNRYLIEHRVSYRGIAGSVDIYDRFTKRTTDWKTAAKARIRQYQRDGVPKDYLTQLNIYAQGLIEQGEQVDVIALTFIPRDGKLTDIWSWAESPNKSLADEAIDRFEAIRARALLVGPAEVEATPTVFCGWCPFHRKNATDLTVACPGRNDNA
jgi:hypothetical protein